MVDHTSQCPLRAFNTQHSDAARKIADQWNLHRVADQYGSINQWIAVRLADGSSDGVLYASKSDAARHQRGSEHWYSYLCISPTTMNACDAEIFLSVQRRLHDRGFRMTDPDARGGGPQIVKRGTREDMLALTRGVATNLYLPGRD